MQPVRRTQGFTNGEAQFGGPPGGFVWSVQLNVPTAANSDTFQLYINGEQLTSAAGTGLMGPVQVFSGETVTIKSSTVASGTKAFLYGQVDKQGQQPSGIFPVISGGVVTTTATYPLSTPVSGQLTQAMYLSANPILIFSTPTLAAGIWLVTAAVTVGGIANTDNVDIEIQAGTATATFSGQTSATLPGGANGYVTLTLSCLVTITSQGTLEVFAGTNGPSTSEAVTTTYVDSFSGASGWTATRVA